MTNSQFHLSGKKISKYFSLGKNIFKNVDVNILNGSAIAITGENGSGKSTLLKILSGLIQPSKGDIDFVINGKTIKKDLYFQEIGFVSPYLILYEEFSPVEHFHITADLQGGSLESELSEEYLKKFKLYLKRNDHIKTFSSGMKQRVKYIQAILHQPKILFLDEPFTNLDHEGIETIKEIMERQLKNNGALIIASNDERETALCNEFINLSNYK